MSAMAEPRPKAKKKHHMRTHLARDPSSLLNPSLHAPSLLLSQTANPLLVSAPAAAPSILATHAAISTATTANLLFSSPSVRTTASSLLASTTLLSTANTQLALAAPLARPAGPPSQLSSLAVTVWRGCAAPVIFCSRIVFVDTC